MVSGSTAPHLKNFNTVAIGQVDTVSKNQKVIGLRCTRMQGKHDSSMSSSWKDENEYLSCDWAYSLLEKGVWRNVLSEYSVAYSLHEQYVTEMVAVYKSGNDAYNLDINSLYVKEYVPVSSVHLLHSLLDLGAVIFKDARPSNELEAKSINRLLRSKAQVISSEPI